MAYTVNDIEKILDFSTWPTRKKIDELLRIDCDLYCNLGKESKKSEREVVKKKSKQIYRAIKTLDQDLGAKFLLYMDR